MESVEDIDAVEVDYTDNPQEGVDAQKAQEVADKFADFQSAEEEKEAGSKKK